MKKKERKKNEKRDSVRRTRTVFTKEKTKWMDGEEGEKEGEFLWEEES